MPATTSAMTVVSPLETAQPTLRVTMFGGLDVHVDGHRVERWRAGRSRRLFEYLVIHRDTLVTRDRLFEVLWPDCDLTEHTSSLKVASHGVRQALGARCDGTGPTRLLHRDGGYVLRADDLVIDVAEFEQLVESGLALARAGQEDLAHEDLSAAMRLYRGDFLEGETDDWIVGHREYLRSLAERALQELRAEAEAAGDVHQLITLCQRTLDFDRHHEAAYRTLVAVHGRLGEVERARRWYGLCATRLRQDLGVDPDPRTTDALRRALGRGNRARAAGSAQVA